MKAGTLILSRADKNMADFTEFGRSFSIGKQENNMKIWLDFKRGNSHALRGNAVCDAPASRDAGASM
jgi:hypothetical protein